MLAFDVPISSSPVLCFAFFLESALVFVGAGVSVSSGV